MQTAELPVREATLLAHQQTLESIAAACAWWSGEDRIAIVEEARHAVNCILCKQRREALSPATIAGEHDHNGQLPDAAIEVIHAMRNDSGRLTRRWFDSVMASGLKREAYVEMVSVVASSVVVDTFAQGIGATRAPLPTPRPGEPTEESSTDIVEAGAWIPIAAQGTANILRSLGLVPNAVKLFFGAFNESYYMGSTELALGRRQVELVASKVSAVNECFY